MLIQALTYFTAARREEPASQGCARPGTERTVALPQAWSSPRAYLHTDRRQTKANCAMAAPVLSSVGMLSRRSDVHTSTRGHRVMGAPAADGRTRTRACCLPSQAFLLCGNRGHVCVQRAQQWAAWHFTVSTGRCSTARHAVECHKRPCKPRAICCVRLSTAAQLSRAALQALAPSHKLDGRCGPRGGQGACVHRPDPDFRMNRWKETDGYHGMTSLVKVHRCRVVSFVFRWERCLCTAASQVASELARTRRRDRSAPQDAAWTRAQTSPSDRSGQAFATENARASGQCSFIHSCEPR